MKSTRRNQIIRFFFCCLNGLFAVALLMLTGCGQTGQNTFDDNQTVVAGTIFPLADWCRNIVPEGTVVLTIVPPNQSPHFFEADISSVKQLSKARLVVRMGFGVDDWVAGMIDNTRNEQTRVLVLQEEEAQGVHSLSEHAHGGEHHGHDHVENPHLWLDPVWAQEAVRMISDELIAIMPDKHEEIEKRTQDYLLKLAALNGEIAETINALPHKDYVGYHGAFQPFAQRYGLNEAATIEPWAGKEPSVEQVKKIVATLQSMSRPVIYIEPQLNRQSVTMLAQEGNATVLTLDPIGNPDDPERDSYIDTMRFNLNAFKEGLGAKTVNGERSP